MAKVENSNKDVSEKIADLALAAEKIREMENMAAENAPKNSYDLKEDFQMLSDLNLIKEIAIKIQLKKHPNKKINDLLDRRMNLESSTFTGPHALSVAASFMIIFFVALIVWAIFWVFATLLNFSALITFMSGLLSVFVFVGFAIALFRPFPIIDEEKLLKHITDEMKSLRSAANIDEQKTTTNSNNTDTEN